MSICLSMVYLENSVCQRIKVASWVRSVKPGSWEWRQCLVFRWRWEQHKTWNGVDHCFPVTAIWLRDTGLDRVQENKAKLGAVVQRQERTGNICPFSVSLLLLSISYWALGGFPPRYLISGGGVLVKSHFQ